MFKFVPSPDEDDRSVVKYVRSGQTAHRSDDNKEKLKGLQIAELDHLIIYNLIASSLCTCKQPVRR